MVPASRKTADALRGEGWDVFESVNAEGAIELPILIACAHSRLWHIASLGTSEVGRSVDEGATDQKDRFHHGSSVVSK
jgi:hypothetical protein